MNSGSAPNVQDYFADVNVPNVDAMRLQLEELVSQGTISPEEAQTILMDPSAMNSIKIDPKLQEAQMAALAEMQDIGSSGGLRKQDKARLNQIKLDEDSSNRGRREAILQNMQARGMGGSGMELAAQMQSQQDSAMRQSQRDMDVGAMAEQRALEAIMQSGNMAGNMRGQSFDEQSAIARQNDAIGQFNAQNRQGQVNRNVDARNQAQMMNLQNNQNISNQNVGLRNQQQAHNRGLLQQDFQNQMQRAGGQSGVSQTNAQIAGQNSQNRANAMNQNIAMGAGLAATAFGGPMAGMATKRFSEQALPDDQRQRQQGMKDGGIVEGEALGFDSELRALEPGELVIKKDDVPGMLGKMHQKENGEFDVASFLDMVTGHKYGYRTGGK